VPTKRKKKRGKTTGASHQKKEGGLPKQVKKGWGFLASCHLVKNEEKKRDLGEKRDNYGVQGKKKKYVKGTGWKVKKGIFSTGVESWRGDR